MFELAIPLQSQDAEGSNPHLLLSPPGGPTPTRGFFCFERRLPNGIRRPFDGLHGIDRLIG